MSGEVDERLLALAGHLTRGLGDRLRELIAADSVANEVVDLRARAQRAEDLAAEVRRQMKPLLRRDDDLKEARREAADWLHGERRPGGLDCRFCGPLGLVRALVTAADNRIALASSAPSSRPDVESPSAERGQS